MNWYLIFDILAGLWIVAGTMNVYLWATNRLLVEGETAYISLFMVVASFAYLAARR